MRERSEIGILKLNAEIEEAAGFHLQFDERERIVSEDNDFYRQVQLSHYLPDARNDRRDCGCARGAELSIAVLNESAAVATACGHKPSENFLSRNAAAMTRPESSLTSSMYRDLRKRAPVEADHILGDFIERGSPHGVATPLLKAAFVNLRVYQEGLSKR